MEMSCHVRAKRDVRLTDQYNLVHPHGRHRCHHRLVTVLLLRNLSERASTMRAEARHTAVGRTFMSPPEQRGALQVELEPLSSATGSPSTVALSCTAVIRVALHCTLRSDLRACA